MKKGKRVMWEAEEFEAGAEDMELRAMRLEAERECAKEAAADAWEFNHPEEESCTSS